MATQTSQPTLADEFLGGASKGAKPGKTLSLAYEFLAPSRKAASENYPEKPMPAPVNEGLGIRTLDQGTPSPSITDRLSGLASSVLNRIAPGPSAPKPQGPPAPPALQPEVTREPQRVREPVPTPLSVAPPEISLEPVNLGERNKPLAQITSANQALTLPAMPV